MAYDKLNKLNTLASLGRFGDDEIRDVHGQPSHVTSEEAGLIDNFGPIGEAYASNTGAGTINPITGLREYHKKWYPHTHWKLNDPSTWNTSDLWNMGHEGSGANLGAHALTAAAVVAAAYFTGGAGLPATLSALGLKTAAGVGAGYMTAAAAGQEEWYKERIGMSPSLAQARSKEEGKKITGQAIDDLIEKSHELLGEPGKTGGTMREGFEKNIQAIQQQRTGEFSNLRRLTDELKAKGGLAHSGSVSKSFKEQDVQLAQGLSLDVEAEETEYKAGRKGAMELLTGSIRSAMSNYQMMFGDAYGDTTPGGINIEDWLSSWDTEMEELEDIDLSLEGKG